MLKSKPGAKFAKATKKLSNLKRTVSSSLEFIRKREYEKNRLDSRRTLKYSARRKMSFPHKFTDYVQWSLNLKNISKRHGVNYKELIQKAIKKANKEKRVAVIVEFGPGKGEAINQASRELKGKAKFFGFGDCADKAWIKHKSVKYIQEVEQSFRKYFPENSIDFLFSHMGLAHAQNFDSALRNTLPCLRVGGVLETDVFAETKSRFKESKQKKQLFKLKGMLFELTKTPYYFFNEKSNDVGSVLTFKRIK
ncbi:MAG: hypothetical protein PHY04_01420 [Candidatus ainarchaeum sp.]|jgi:hypothetical protein|nr:hypothetical protein [Candidatus ainarchaeum sp.]MDD4128375.1 hypothetical protein [Candidatus ainarchaeum sp.]MDD4467929.1 hypothetical protein [Candidatus ainarchaeum sp.]